MLLQIESAFLSANAENLRTRQIKKLSAALTSSAKKKFTTSLQLAAEVAQAVNWFRSEEGKTAMNDAGISWNVETFGMKTYGWKKSFLYRMVKVGSLDASIIDNFHAACDAAEAEGEPSERSLEQLLRFVKNGAVAHTPEGEENEGEGSGEGENEGGGEQPTGTLLTLSFKGHEGGNVSVRIDAQGFVKTSNSREEIEAAVSFLMCSLVGNNID